MAVVLSDDEKERIRYHLGYPSMGSVATMAIGVPAAYEPNFVLESAMNRLLDAAATKARAVIAKLDCIDEKLFCNVDLLEASKVGNIEVNLDVLKQQRGEYLYWRAGLANMFGVEPNPYDMRFGGAGGTGVNVRVNHG